MSFAKDLKQELADKVPGARHCRVAELAGMMLCGGVVETGEGGERVLTFSTEKEIIAKKCFTFLKKSFNMRIGAGETTVESRRGKTYTVSVTGDSDVRRCAEEMGFAWPEGRDLRAAETLSDWALTMPEATCCARSFTRGVFLMRGTMNDPEKSYHFEVAVPSESIGRWLAGFLQQFDCEPRMRERRGSWVVYLKDAEQIADALTVMDAVGARLRFEEVRVMRNKRGEVQRMVNCEVSNLAKTTQAAGRQIEAIELIERVVGLHTLPEELRKMAKLRLENPEYSLQELGDGSTPPVGRSCVNHRLQKLCEIAEGLRLKEGG